LSDEEILAELPSADFLPEEPQTQQEQPRSQMSELIEIFKNCSDYNDGINKLKRQSTTVNGERRFEANGKTYSIANAKKCLRKLRGSNGFKTKTPAKLEMREVTYKEETPYIPPEPETTTQQQQDVDPYPDIDTRTTVYPQETLPQYQQPAIEKKPFDPQARQDSLDLGAWALELVATLGSATQENPKKQKILEKMQTKDSLDKLSLAVNRTFGKNGHVDPQMMGGFGLVVFAGTFGYAVLPDSVTDKFTTLIEKGMDTVTNKIVNVVNGGKA